MVQSCRAKVHFCIIGIRKKHVKLLLIDDCIRGNYPAHIPIFTGRMFICSLFFRYISLANSKTVTTLLHTPGIKIVSNYATDIMFQGKQYKCWGLVWYLVWYWFNIQTLVISQLLCGRYTQWQLPYRCYIYIDFILLFRINTKHSCPN